MKVSCLCLLWLSLCFALFFGWGVEGKNAFFKSPRTSDGVSAQQKKKPLFSLSLLLNEFNERVVGTRRARNCTVDIALTFRSSSNVAASSTRKPKVVSSLAFFFHSRGVKDADVVDLS